MLENTAEALWGALMLRWMLSRVDEREAILDAFLDGAAWGMSHVH